MTDIELIKSNSKKLLDKIDKMNTGVQDVTTNQSQATDFNFDILKNKFQGSGFEDEVGFMCGLASKHLSKHGNGSNVIPILTGIKGVFISNNDGTMDDYGSFIDEMINVLSNDVRKAEYPDMTDAQAKLMQLQHYIDSSGLTSKKWMDYLSYCRRLAAVGNTDFDPTPPLDRTDWDFLNEKNRKETIPATVPMSPTTPQGGKTPSVLGGQSVI